jgi:hypothetical protein
MTIIQETKSKDIKMNSLVSHDTTSYKKLVAKDIFSNEQMHVVMGPIDHKRVSKSANSLNMKSAVKAGLVFFATVGGYYLDKTTGIFSYFGWGEKNPNSKDVGISEIMKVKNRANALTVKTNLETTRRTNNDPSVNRNVQTYKDEDSLRK